MRLTSTTPSRANRSPRYHGLALHPEKNPPPWIHTRTGSPAEPGSGVKTLRLRQLSPAMTGSGMRARSWGACGAVGPNTPASLVPSQRGCRRGGPKRSSPTGGRGVGHAEEGGDVLRPPAAHRARRGDSRRFHPHPPVSVCPRCSLESVPTLMQPPRRCGYRSCRTRDRWGSTAVPSRRDEVPPDEAVDERKVENR